MAIRISTEKQQQIIDLFKKGKSLRFIESETSSGFQTIKKVLAFNNLQKKTLSTNAKKLLLRQKKIKFDEFELMKNQVQKDQRYLSNLNDPVTGCGRHALAKAAKEANQTSSYSKSLIGAIDDAEQLVALFKGQQILFGFKE